ncbi:hypothetical protein Fcan01_17268 [Folsomia candida]|uniref:Uncharacterized protein n=1 Tax=Folsomia candida TaxID=158441 RepID=A0A226DUH6_FOLCA|nr:hypothetical protein Fcan01_17268 [Folsomia candida]
MPVLSTRISNLARQQSLSHVVNSKSGICNTCTAELFNLDAILSSVANFFDLMTSFTPKTHPKFRIFVYSHLSKDPTSIQNLPQHLTRISTAQALFVKIIKSPALHINRVYSLRALKFVQLCFMETCNTSKLNQLLVFRGPISFDLSNQYVSLPEYLELQGNFWDEFEWAEHHLLQYCSAATMGYDDEVGGSHALPPAWCLQYNFFKDTNVSVPKPELERTENVVSIQNLKSIDITRRMMHTYSIDIHPHAVTHDGLFYFVFINKSELGQVCRLRNHLTVTFG